MPDDRLTDCQSERSHAFSLSLILLMELRLAVLLQRKEKAIAMNDYTIAGLHIRSEFPLPGVAAWFFSEHVPDVIVSRRSDALDGAGFHQLSPVLSTQGDRAVRFEIPEIAQFIILGGRYIGVYCHPSAKPEDIRCLLLGPAFSMLCIQRSLMPIQASCIRIGNAGVAFVGLSGLGKTALVSGLADRGHKLLSDDFSVLDIVDGIPSIVPTLAVAKVWEDNLEANRIPYAGMYQTRHMMRRFVRPFPHIGHSPQRLSQIYFLERGAEFSIQRITPSEATSRLSRNIRHSVLAYHLGVWPQLSSRAQSIAREGQAYRLSRSTIGNLEQDVDRLEKVLAP